MDKQRRTMDIVSPQRPHAATRRQKWSRQQLAAYLFSALAIATAIAGVVLYTHRNDQRIAHDRYQVVYLTSGQIYFGKLQNTSGQYLSLKDVYTIDSQAPSSNDATGSVATPNKILKVSQQVYGPDDSMAIRSDQVQFWQNLRSDSKVSKAIASSPEQ